MPHPPAVARTAIKRHEAEEKKRSERGLEAIFAAADAAIAKATDAVIYVGQDAVEEYIKQERHDVPAGYAYTADEADEAVAKYRSLGWVAELKRYPGVHSGRQWDIVLELPPEAAD